MATMCASNYLKIEKVGMFDLESADGFVIDYIGLGQYGLYAADNLACINVSNNLTELISHVSDVYGPNEPIAFSPIASTAFRLLFPLSCETEIDRLVCEVTLDNDGFAA